MDVKDRIRDSARELFRRYGIRSVSMDDIATHLAMSKKTIYQFYADKDELVDAVVDNEVKHMQDECVLTQKSAGDAVEEVFLTLAMAQVQLSSINPVLLFDMQKFHPRAFQKFMAHKNEFLLEIIRHNLERGIREGLYRENLDIDIIARYRLETLMVPFNMDLFPPAKYSLITITQAILEHFLYGLASEKGYQLILKYQKEQQKTRVV